MNEKKDSFGKKINTQSLNGLAKKMLKKRSDVTGMFEFFFLQYNQYRFLRKLNNKMKLNETF